MLERNKLESYLARWEEKALVRSAPRRVLPELCSDGHHFPLFRQPLCIHPAVIAKGEEVVAAGLGGGERLVKDGVVDAHLRQGEGHVGDGGLFGAGEFADAVDGVVIVECE